MRIDDIAGPWRGFAISSLILMRAAFFATLMLFSGASGLAANEYPSKRVTIVVPFAAGGSADVYARVLAQYLSEDLKQPFIVENRPGAGSIVGTETVKTAPADGHTLLLISNTHTVNETLFTKKNYALMDDFIPVAPINYADLVLVSRPGLAAKNLPDLIKLAQSQPGKLTYASSGPGTPYHMAGEMLKALGRMDILHVPYRTSSGARTDVVAGHVDLMFDALTTMVEAIKGAQVVGLATTGQKRTSQLPDLPTVAEYVPGYEATIWLGVMAPRKTPPEVADKLNAAITAIVKRPDLQASWRSQGAEPMTMPTGEFATFMQGDIKKWAEVVRISGAKVE
jgi:tripartite-type tricarboxylate transporter receptor subunit TctC